MKLKVRLGHTIAKSKCKIENLLLEYRIII